MSKFLLGVLAFLFWLLYHRTNFVHDTFLHYPASEQIKISNKPLSNDYLAQGSFDHSPNLSFLDKISRKKFDNYIITIDNTHKVEIILVDLSYASNIQINLFSEKWGTHSFEIDQMISVNEEFGKNQLKINKQSLKFNLKQSKITLNGKDIIKSDFNIRFAQQNTIITIEVSIYQTNDECFTSSRKQIKSFKCFAGFAEGKISTILDKGGKRQFLELNNINTKTAYDGFRGSGFKWQWVWGIGIGLGQDHSRIGINMGHLKNLGEDLIFINETMRYIKGITYQINENITIGNSITIKGSKPQLELQFKVFQKYHTKKDMLFINVDMVKMEGFWSGWIENQDKSIMQFKKIPGLIQTAKSVF